MPVCGSRNGLASDERVYLVAAGHEYGGAAFVETTRRGVPPEMAPSRSTPNRPGLTKPDCPPMESVDRTRRGKAQANPVHLMQRRAAVNGPTPTPCGGYPRTDRRYGVQL